MLQESEIHFEVLQDYGSGGRANRITLGVVKLNLAEYAAGMDEEEEEVVRRYLMKESKINSTLKLGFQMRQIEGDRHFSTYV